MSGIKLHGMTALSTHAKVNDGLGESCLHTRDTLLLESKTCWETKKRWNLSPPCDCDNCDRSTAFVAHRIKKHRAIPSKFKPWKRWRPGHGDKLE